MFGSGAFRSRRSRAEKHLRPSAAKGLSGHQLVPLKHRRLPYVWRQAIMLTVKRKNARINYVLHSLSPFRERPRSMFRFAHRLFQVAVVFAVLQFLAPAARAATAEQVQAAIDKARAFLLKQQQSGGQWELDATRTTTGHDWQKMQGDTFGGYTALATYALLASGSRSDDAPIQRAVAFLKKADITGTYALGCRLEVYQVMGQETGDVQYKKLAQLDADHLVAGLNKKGVNIGMWNYTGIGGSIDSSCSQYGVLGLWAATQTGAEVKGAIWNMIDNTWRQNQFDDGGWAYRSSPLHPDANDHVTPAMTAAGIATLFITQEYTRGDQGINCTGNQPNDNVANGLDWMTRHFDQVNDLYTFYGIERIGVSSGYKFFGTTDWYAQIADKLVKAQNPDGNWLNNGLAGYPGEMPISSAAFGLLFLARGGAPVMFNKLDYSIRSDNRPHEANWNQRPRDIFNLARWAGDQAEATFNCQVVNLKVSVDDLHDAPILYIAGNQDLALSDKDADKLRQFVNEGGLILGNADCNDDTFKMSFIALGQKMFPKYEFRALPPNHRIFNETFKKFRTKPDVWGLNNGVRELMLLIPTGDPARYWQTDSFLGRTDSFAIGFDIFQYSTDAVGLRKKGDSYIVRADPAVKPTRIVKVARLLIGDNPDPEPGGWPRLAAILHNAPYKIDVQVTPIKSTDSLAGFQIIHLTGTTAFKLTDDDRTNLLEFTEHGGMLIVDAAGGSPAFADAAEAELSNIFGPDAVRGLARPLHLDNILYTNPAAPITAIAYRNFAKNAAEGNLRAPHIDAIDVRKHTVCLYSREDLSAGMVGEQVDGVIGYTPAVATDLMRNMVLYSIDQKELRAKAATMPAITPSVEPANQPVINTGH
jgi:hypothetical protein